MSKMHPLHTVDMVVNHINNTGEYFDETRCTGRTTMIALRAIIDAMAKPYTEVRLRDHQNSEGSPTQMQNQALVCRTEALVRAMNLRGFSFNSRPYCTITFGGTPAGMAPTKPERDHAMPMWEMPPYAKGYRT